MNAAEPSPSEESTPKPGGARGSHKALLVLGACAIATAFFLAGQRAQPEPSKTDQTIVVERSAPSVITAITSLARLSSVQFHMERIVDITRKEQALWGLVQAEDNILLVAAGEVEAGIDLRNVQATDVSVDEAARTVRIVLPAPELFSTRIDNERTYVHSRRTNPLTRPDQHLETEARKRAEQAIRDGALQAGILQLAEQSAHSTLRALARSFGYDVVLIETASSER